MCRLLGSVSSRTPSYRAATARARIASPVLGSAANGTDATRNSKASDQPNRAARGQAIVDTPELANTDHMIIYCGQVGKPGRAREMRMRRVEAVVANALTSPLPVDQPRRGRLRLSSVRRSPHKFQPASATAADRTAPAQQHA